MSVNMRAVVALLALAAQACALGSHGYLRASSHVVDKSHARSQTKGLSEVVSILANMMTEFRRQENDDRHAWEGYQKWAEETETDRNEYVRQQVSITMSNTATLNAKREAISQLTSELSQLASDISSMHGSIKELNKMRKDEHEQHEEALTDLTKTIDAVGRASQILEGHYAATAGALTEIKKRVQYAMTLSGSDNIKKSALASLIQSDNPDWLAKDGAQFNTYSSNGGGNAVLTTLSDMRSALEGNRQQSIDTESQNTRDYQDTKEAKESEVSRMTKEQKEKIEQKADAEAAVSMAQAAIDAATTNKADAESYLAELSAEKETFGKEYQTREQTRGSEITATQAALDALQSISAGAKDSTGVLLALTSSTRSLRPCVKCSEQAQKLKILSKKLQSGTLMQVASELAQRTKGGFSPEGFEPVKNLLEGLIARLEAEASAETSHHDWCENEKTSSASTQTERTEALKELQGSIERLTTETSTLKSEITFMRSEISRVGQENRDATANRQEQHEAFATAKKDHDEVISAITKALEALGGQYSLLQRASANKRSAAKQTPFKSYSSGEGGAANALGMLEDLNNQYSSARSALVNDEKVSQAAYDELTATNNQFLTDTDQGANTKTAERRSKIGQLQNSKNEHEQNFIELGEVSKYLQDLRPSCDDIRTTFEERKKRREAEISALRGCLDVLSGP